MKVSRYTVLIFFISLALFFLPFFWFSPGEMDIGGDSSRLYFYDPLGYLPNQSLYSIAVSAFGWENLGFFGIPFFLFLAALKILFSSPTWLIAAFNGISLSVAFLFCYLVVKELLSYTDQNKKNKIIIEWSAIVAGIFYVFSPSEIYGWAYAIVTHNQVFLNPLMFFLLLRFFTTQKMKYIYAALLVTFVFAPNFSFIGAPPFFAFYPLSLLFLVVYTKWIRHSKISIKKILIGIVLFLFVQGFHLIPQIVTSLLPGGYLYANLASSEAKFDRGLSYFTSLAPSIKVSLDFMALPQLTDLQPYVFLFIVFPLIIILGFLFGKNKTLPLLGVCFLISLFFASANITQTGFNFYKSLFGVPGFSMFRNFYGQWNFAFLFFYILLFSQALAVVLIIIKQKMYKIILVGGILFLLIYNAFPFINGSLVHKMHWTSKGVKTAVTFDPKYQNIITYMRSLPQDGKVLTLPLNDHGYQIISGINGGAYQGPSTIAYLAGRNDFSGYDVMGIYKDMFLNLVKKKDYTAIKDLLAILQIKYIFYNADSKAYDTVFPGFPYNHVRAYMPVNQKEYQEFIKNLHLIQRFQMDNTYYIYELPDNEYVPHIYSPTQESFFESKLSEEEIPFSFLNDKRIGLYTLEQTPAAVLDRANIQIPRIDNPYRVFLDSIPEPPFVSPFVSHKLSSFIYPFIVSREKKQIQSIPAGSDESINRKILLAEKRINELDKWKGEIALLENIKNVNQIKQNFYEPSSQQFPFQNYKYNYWEVSLARYRELMIDTIHTAEKSNSSAYSLLENKKKIKTFLLNHKQKLNQVIEQTNALSEEKKIYLLRLSNELFNELFDTLHLQLPAPEIREYTLDKMIEGTYEVFLKTDTIQNIEPAKLSMQIGERKLYPQGEQPNQQWIQFEDIPITATTSPKLSLKIDGVPSLLDSTKWKTFEQPDAASILIDKSVFSESIGIAREIFGWRPNLTYMISFDYMTNGKNYKFHVNEKNKKELRIVLQENLKAATWKSYQGVVQSDKDAKYAFLHFFRSKENGWQESLHASQEDKLEIKNIKVFQIPLPQIILKKKQPYEKNPIPAITFQRINPTKYLVTVKGAVKPYTLIFSDYFHKNWKIYAEEFGKETDFKRLFMGAVGKIQQKILGVFMHDTSRNVGKTHTYFEGELYENPIQNVFLAQSTFDAWGQKSLPPEKHFLANGYANAWYIELADFQNKKDYTFTLEMESQRIFYESAMITGIIVFLIFCLLVYAMKKNI